MTVQFTTIEKLKRFTGKKVNFSYDGEDILITNYVNDIDWVRVNNIQTISNHRDLNKIEIFTDNGNICLIK